MPGITNLMESVLIKYFLIIRSRNLLKPGEIQGHLLLTSFYVTDRCDKGWGL